MYKTIRNLSLLVCGTLLLAACNTIEGLGRDTSAVGKAVSEAAREAPPN
jgi:predicted small secreted protein